MMEELQRYTKTIFGNFEPFNKGEYVKLADQVDYLAEKQRIVDKAILYTEEAKKEREALCTTIEEQEALRVTLTAANKRLVQDKERTISAYADIIMDSDRQRALLWVLVVVQGVSWFL